MSTRDELAADLFQHLPSWLRVDRMTTGVELADALIAEGWCKKPSERDIRMAAGITEIEADAILALMDRGQ